MNSRLLLAIIFVVLQLGVLALIGYRGDLGIYAHHKGVLDTGQSLVLKNRKNRSTIKVVVEASMVGENGTASIDDLIDFFVLDPTSSRLCSVNQTDDFQEQDPSSVRILRYASRQRRVGKTVTLCVQ